VFDPNTSALRELVYDASLRRSLGQLIRVIDFTDRDLAFRMVRVEGDVESFEIATYSDLGIPMPEGTGSDRGLKVTIKAGGTVYIRIAAPMKAFKPFVAYTDIYALDSDIEVLMYVTLGGYLSAYRQRLPKTLTLPKGNWGRLVTHWFQEFHHGQAEVVIELRNPDTSNAHTAVIGLVMVSLIDVYIKGFCLLWGWESNYVMKLSNESVDIDLHVMLPTNACRRYTLSIQYEIAGDGTNALNISATLLNGGANIGSDSNTSTTPKGGEWIFRVLTIREGTYGYEFIVLRIRLSTSGTGTLSKLCLVLYAMDDEYIYQKTVTITVPANGSETIADYRTGLRHVCGAEIEVDNSSNSGDIEIRGETVEGDTLLAVCRAGQKCTLRVEGRYRYIYAKNGGGTSVDLTAVLRISDAILTT